MSRTGPRFSWNVCLTAIAFVVLAIAFAVYVRSEKEIDHANSRRHQSFLLADQLRQSSEDLTRMARSYVATSDPQYKKYYDEILAIRDGKTPRPSRYQYFYWDFVVTKQTATQTGKEQAIPLLELMRQAGMTEQELAKLTEAKTNSDTLTATEFDAMKRVESAGAEAEAKRSEAVRALFDERYYLAKAAILKPIDEFIQLVDRRTIEAVENAQSRATIFRVLFIAGGLGLMILLWRIERTLRATLGGTVDEVHYHLTRIGSGDFSTAIPVLSGQEKSVLGRLVSTQCNLQRIERERTLTQVALKQSEQWKELALSGANLGLCDWTVSSGKALFDGRWCSMLGYQVEELEPTVNTWIALMHPDDATTVQQTLNRYLINEAPTYEAEFRMKHKAGHWVWIMVRGKVVERDQAGGPLRMVGTHMDITGRKHAEAALKENEARYRMLVEWSPEPFAIHREGKVLYVNPAAIALFGATSLSNLVGKPFLDLVHPDFHELVQSKMKLLLKEGTELPLTEMKYIKVDGTTIDVEVQALVFLYDGVPAIYTSGRDITARLHAERELRLANLLGDQALKLTKAGYWHVPLDGSGWYNSSERAVTIFGDIPRKGWRYRVMEEWFINVEAGDKTAAARTLDSFLAAVEGRIPEYNAIYAYKRPVDGRIIWIHALAHVVKDATGRATDLYGVTQDITESKLAEDAIRSAKEAAEAAALAKSDFLATMSHEIRTPMNGVLGFTELLLTTPLDDKQKKYASIIKNSGDTLLIIINDILDFSKLEAGKISLDPQPVDLAQTIEEITGLLGPQAQEKTVGLRIDYPPNIPRRLVADSNRLRQIGLNLVGNALKFTERGSVTVRVSATERDTERFLRIEVIDTGLGIPKDKQAQLFQKFAQADASTTRRFGGTGLGLAISKRLVEAMGGEVGLESEPGFGSTFWFTFPLVEAPEALPSANLPLANPVTVSAGFTSSGLRILVAEDGLINQMFVTTLLERFGCQADVAADGREAVQLYRTRSYDLILMDCRMPEMDGFEATVEIRKSEKLKSGPAIRIPIIALTANAMQHEQLRCLDVGMDGCLTKPFQARDLMEMLERWAPQTAPRGQS